MQVARALLVLVLLVTACEPDEPDEPAPSEEEDPPPVDPLDPWDCEPSEDYCSGGLRGWTVHLARELHEEHPDLAQAVLEQLDSDLETVEGLLDEPVLDFLRTVPFWLELAHPAFVGGVYHPSDQWLIDNGYPPEWARSIQLGNAENYLSWTAVQPAIVLHELSHAWHHQHLGYDDPSLLAAYDGAMASGLYDEVEYADGSLQVAYATTNVQEYFAELSEAWFWENDFYPFVQAELLEHDPQGAQAVEDAWTWQGGG